MAYGDFTLAQLKKTFGLSFQESSGLFSTLPDVDGSAGLKEALADGIDLAVAIGTENAREDNEIRVIYGVVTIGTTWQFL